MRTTMQTMQQNFLFNVNKTNLDMYRLNKQISSGKQMSKISDNPVNMVNALGLRTSLTEIEQYQENLNFGDSIITASENSLTQIKDLIMRAKVLAVQQINAPMTPENRTNAAEEVQHLWEQAIILGNSEVNGKYVFGGYRTTGYTVEEPAPFVQDVRDGYHINGSGLSRIEEKLTGLVSNAPGQDIDSATNDLVINGENIGVSAPGGIIDLTTGGLTVNGLNMGGAANLKTSINTDSTDVTATLTTLYEGAAAVTDPGATTATFYINGETVNVTTGGTGVNQVAQDVRDAINAISNLTGVTAEVGDGANGGTGDGGGVGADRIVLKNTRKGDETAITISGLSAGETALTGLANVSQTADATHNTGEISLSSASSFAITTSAADDTILNLVGLGGGSKGFADETNDGRLIYGSRLAGGDLTINNTAVTTQADSISTVYADISAQAKAEAINNTTSTHGVRAETTPANLLASGAVEAGTEKTKLTGIVEDNLIINAGDLAINGAPTITAVNVAGAPTNGLNMQRASDVKDALNEISSSSGVTANLTTLHAGAAATTAGTSTISFTLNGATIDVNANGTTATQIAQQVATAINSSSNQTGVTAVRGNGNNGGVADSIVLYNTLPGDETPIIISDLSAAETTRIGLSDTAASGQIADATHNTGKITFSSDSSFTISSPNNPADDLILNELGLDGGESNTGITGDLAGDGVLQYGSTPVYLNTGDLVINGVDIFNNSSAITSQDSTNALINAINGQQTLTGVVAGRNSGGYLILTALDGRNMHIQTSAKGEKVTHLNSSGAAVPQSKIYFGEVRLLSDRQFTLASNVTPTDAIETGFAALGLAGGTAVTGETGDTAGDGEILVDTIYHENGYVRYAGDRNNDIAIKVGQQSTIEISKNGKDAVLDTGVFSALKNFEDYLRGQNYKAVTGSYRAADTSVTLDSGDTGLDLEDEITSGTFTVTVMSHDSTPPQTFFSTGIDINPSEDTLDDVAQRLNGIPGLKAYWDAGGHLRIESTDPERYTFTVNGDTSNFLKATGTTLEDIQVSSLSDSLAELDTLMEDLTIQISDFGARANRIGVQNQIYANLELATTEILSEKEDTDIIEALMELKNKQIAYEAALSTAAKTMQLSLVNYL